MGTDTLITIIMPSYNVGRYIRKCMESVLAQTYENLEILAVDAGSTDGTLEILREYEEFDDRVKVIRSEKKSYGYQVNLGIHLARGEYIGIVETDDVIRPHMYELLCDAAEKNNVDYAKIQGVNSFQISPTISYRSDICDYKSLNITGRIIDPGRNPQLVIYDRFLWLGLYRKSFILDNDILLSETDGAAYQDIGFQIQVLEKARRAIYIDSSEYLYRQDNENASGYSSKAFAYLKYEYAKHLIGKECSDKKRISCLYLKMIGQYLHRYHIMAKSGRFWEEALTDMETIREWIIEALDDGYISDDAIDDELRNRLEVLKAGTRDTYGSYLMDYLRSVSRMRRWLNGLNDFEMDRRNEKQYIVFGCGINGQYVHCLLEKAFPGSVAAFCDNNANSFGDTFCETAVLSPGDAARHYSNAIYILTSGKYGDAMRQQLKDYGIPAGRIVDYSLDRNTDMLMLDWNEIRTKRT